MSRGDSFKALKNLDKVVGVAEPALVGNGFNGQRIIGKKLLGHSHLFLIDIVVKGITGLFPDDFGQIVSVEVEMIRDTI